MRKLFIFITILSLAYFAQAQENSVFYYYKGEKIYLDKIENTKVIHFSKTIDTEQKDYICNYLKTSDYIVFEMNPFMYKIFGNTDRFEANDIISEAIKISKANCKF